MTLRRSVDILTTNRVFFYGVRSSWISMKKKFSRRTEARKWISFFKSIQECTECLEEKEIFRVSLVPLYSLNEENKRFVTGCLANVICFDCHAAKIDALQSEEDRLNGS
jgi:hypothetical protein